MVAISINFFSVPLPNSCTYSGITLTMITVLLLTSINPYTHMNIHPVVYVYMTLNNFYMQMFYCTHYTHSSHLCVQPACEWLTTFYTGHLQGRQNFIPRGYLRLWWGYRRFLTYFFYKKHSKQVFNHLFVCTDYF